MTDTSKIREHMEVVGADGVHIGTVDKVEGQRIKLTRADSRALTRAITIIFPWPWLPRSMARRFGCPRIRMSR